MPWYPCCCACVVGDTIIMFGGNATNAKFNFYLNGTHLGEWTPSEDVDTYIYFADFTPFPRQISWDAFHYADFSDTFTDEREFVNFDRSLLLAGQNELRITGTTFIGSSNPGTDTVRLVAGPVVLGTGFLGDHLYKLDPASDEWLGPLDLQITNRHLGYERTFLFTYPTTCGVTEMFTELNPEPIEFGFTTAALIGRGALDSEEVTTTFTVSGVLTEAGTVAQIAGSSDWAFTATGAASGGVQCVGSTSLTHTCTGSMAGSRGALDGECNVVFATSCQIHGFGRMLGQSNWAFTTQGDVDGVLELTGGTALQFTTIAHLTSVSPLLAGTVNIVFTPVAILKGRGRLTGTTTLTISTSADLNGSLELTGDMALQFVVTADLNAGLEMTGNTSAQFVVSGDLNGEVELTGNTAAQFTTSASLGLDALISGSTSATFFNVSGDLNGEVELTGSTGAQFTTSAAGHTHAEAEASGTTSATFSTQGDVEGEVELTGGTGAQFTTDARGTLRGRLVGNSQMTFSTSGALTDIGGGGGCEHCSGSFPTSKVVRLCGTITNGGCGICADITGEYTLTEGAASGQACTLAYQDSGFACGSLDMSLRFFATEIAFDISIGALSGSSQFKKTGLSAPYDCNTACNGTYTLSFDSSSQCTFGSMTVEVAPAAPSCTHCTGGTTPTALTLIFGGAFANNNCADCSGLGNSFVLTNDVCGDPCVFTYAGSSACGDVVISLTLGSSSITGTIEIDGQTHANLSASVSAPYDCSALRTLTVSGVPGNMACDLTGITSATIEG